MPFTSQEFKHYQRHFLLDEVGMEGQEKLKNAKVAVVGAGGLGSPVLLYLASAGIGTLGIIDFDKIETHNLQRQILYTYEDIGKQKAETAAEKLKLHNPAISLQVHPEKIIAENVEKVLKGYDLIIDGTDNFETRYLVNDTCVLLGKPLVSGAIYKFEGQVSVFNYKGSVDYRHLFPEPPENDFNNCSIVGVIGSICGIVGGLMANETIKIILEKGDILADKMLQIDLLSMNFRVFNIKG